MTKSPLQSEGRKDNAAQPLGKQPGLASDQEVSRNGEKSRRAAGPDGPDATAVGDTFKKKPS
ncbi:hypothetical protein [Phenylobacterium sp.]|uniref:hypothetical protein n=1 Tax=Phenylobacterium sp. TaxID=1871053 RepID=UPI00272FC697|nr:hypothetical protein [Phenylobacterium sp.]MDP1617381.1 hypothetical protein [Phenylobacterium sp.]MDP1985925.1 hypothetical protein [Phenylobacterium sp.]